MNKFKVSQVWLSRCGDEWEIVGVDICFRPYTVRARKKTSGSLATFTINGYLYAQEVDSVCDLITLIKDTEETQMASRTKLIGVQTYDSDGSLDWFYKGTEMDEFVERVGNKETAQARLIAKFSQAIDSYFKKEETVSKLPHEPTPGQFYRTRDGHKMLCVGKGVKGWIYQSADNICLLVYDSPYMFNTTPGDNDIIAPWTDPLPAMEIKRWAVVDNKTKHRGAVIISNSSKEEAEYYLREMCINPNDFEIIELTGTLPATDK
jgi:hypothetical protein